eukprot:CAMPEP_0202878226 /NCGR_PEP_ID=MMETSP1391-20130828/31875_1 /ASSEMBLY_ACC=CAM_ASM_000867 /TAXON_ID=1034604 /ORGANISM="Chlamydomonas leiostraca, Strain SAG 11-49" /LENGTH=63 /DNA_ID=CAMNT_0049560387 /DNA_START=87 /DNA_END=275 /DNA_ORIENTATION=-
MTAGCVDCGLLFGMLDLEQAELLPFPAAWLLLAGACGMDAPRRDASPTCCPCGPAWSAAAWLD